jgi:hypothetical protein
METKTATSRSNRTLKPVGIVASGIGGAWRVDPMKLELSKSRDVLTDDGVSGVARPALPRLLIQLRIEFLGSVRLDFSQPIESLNLRHGVIFRMNKSVND